MPRCEIVGCRNEGRADDWPPLPLGMRFICDTCRDKAVKIAAEKVARKIVLGGKPL